MRVVTSLPHYVMAFMLFAVTQIPFNVFAQYPDVPAFYPIDNMPELGSKQGFALFYVNSEIDAASIEVRGLVTQKIEPQSRESKVWKYRREEFEISMKGLAPGFYVLPLEKGVYQITKVNAPYFDLPFWLDTTKDVRWQFNVFSDHLNYVGHLEVERERGTNYIPVGLHNRIAMDIESLRQALQNTPVTLPLRMGAGVEDSFLSLIKQEKK